MASGQTIAHETVLCHPVERKSGGSRLTTDLMVPEKRLLVQPVVNSLGTIELRGLELGIQPGEEGWCSIPSDEIKY